MDLFSVRNSLSIYWIRQLRRGKIWASLVTEILTHGIPEESARKITMPWAQTWSSKGATITPAVKHFWPYWEQTLLHLVIQPTLPEEVFGTHFWFHPAISKQCRFNWHAQGWGRLWNGDGCTHPVRTLGDLRPIWLGDCKVDQQIKRIVMNLFKNLPREWLRIIQTPDNCDRSLPADIPFEHTAIFNRLGVSIPLESPMSKISKHVATPYGLSSSVMPRNVEGRPDRGYELPDLLINFRRICTRDGLDISRISSRTIWKATRARKIDAPKFSDLYWKLLLGKVVAGDHWLREKANCPVCYDVQLAEHLFWLCPIAQIVWKRLRHIWIAITGSDVPNFPTTWASFLLSGVTMGIKIWGGPNARRRWRILFGEALWAIWLQKCRWSHEDAKFDPPAVLSVFSEALKLRIGRDRLYARSTVKKAKREQFLDLWGFTVDSPSLPIWISH